MFTTCMQQNLKREKEKFVVLFLLLYSMVSLYLQCFSLKKTYFHMLCSIDNVLRMCVCVFFFNFQTRSHITTFFPINCMIICNNFVLVSLSKDDYCLSDKISTFLLLFFRFFELCNEF